MSRRTLILRWTFLGAVTGMVAFEILTPIVIMSSVIFSDTGHAPVHMMRRLGFLSLPYATMYYALSTAAVGGFVGMCAGIVRARKIL